MAEPVMPTEDWRLDQVRQAAAALGYDAQVVELQNANWLQVTLSDAIGSSIQERVHRDEAYSAVEPMVIAYEMHDANLDSPAKRAKHAAHYAKRRGWDVDALASEDGALSVTFRQPDGTIAGRIELISDTSGTAIRSAMDGMLKALYPTRSEGQRS